MRFVPGPDLPTGGRIVGLDGIRDAYESGRGTFRTRATTHIENVTPRRKGIVVTELPYAVGPERVVAKIKDLVNAKKVHGIADLKDLTDRQQGLRLVIEIKNGFHPEAVLEELYRLTPMEETFGINNVALVDGQPRTLGLRELLQVYIDHRIEVVRRRQHVPPQEAPGPPAPGRRPRHRAPQHRRGHPGHPRQRRLRRGQDGPHGAVRAVGDPVRSTSSTRRCAGSPATTSWSSTSEKKRLTREIAALTAILASETQAPRAGLRRARRDRREVRHAAPHGPAGVLRRRPRRRGTAGGRPTTPAYVLMSSTGLLARTIDDATRSPPRAPRARTTCCPRPYAPPRAAGWASSRAGPPDPHRRHRPAVTAAVGPPPSLSGGYAAERIRRAATPTRPSSA